MSPTSYLLHTVLSQSPPCPTLSFIPEPAESCKVMSPYIPPEITDAIISAVDVDLYNTGERTLTMCALVCRAWLPRSRTKLFEAIYIRNQRSYDLLVERFVRSETMSHYLTSVNSFYIQPFGVDSPSSVARLFLIEFAGKLPGLRVWDVGGIDWTHQRPSVKWPLLLSHFRTITYLRLWECRFSSFSDFRRLLTALPLLSTLNILHVTWPAVSPELHLRTTPGPMCRTYWPELRALLIIYDEDGWQCAETFLKWITAALRGSTVKELFCGFFGLPPTGSLRETVVAFVGRDERSVTDLNVHITDGLPLTGFIALESLSLNLDRYQDDWKSVASVLQDVTSKTIQSITFSLVPTVRVVNNDTNFLHFDHDTLEELDRVLSREPFSNLREVIFKVEGIRKSFSAHMLGDTCPSYMNGRSSGWIFGDDCNVWKSTERTRSVWPGDEYSS
ncbi:hypothetical protein L227DRAFT_68325 [Lentinus tigrinus ALCF2SS1-6]|uniref:F-box domain-containing protein n=1 Tax=Lentinus tigrinus ALCF2SS1-6 TaxID=1328759 RepID=A0A5C2SDZ6_9APHY|nr:hypothetical protein L227DRAFT_68325 [Lentinus tigrinus ALCF2SS1-6]